MTDEQLVQINIKEAGFPDGIYEDSVSLNNNLAKPSQLKP